MPNLILRVNMNHSAFRDNEDELAQLLLRVDRRIKDGYFEGRLRDSNGNTVGDWKIADGE